MWCSQLILLDALDANQLRFKHQHTIRRDRPDISLPVPHVRRDGQLSLLPDTHVHQAFVPPVHHHPQSSAQPYTFPLFLDIAQYLPTLCLSGSEVQENTNSPFNNPSRAQFETQRIPARVARVELLARAEQRAAIVHVDLVALDRLPRAFNVRRLVVDLKPGGGGELCEGEGEGCGEEGGEEFHVDEFTIVSRGMGLRKRKLGGRRSKSILAVCEISGKVFDSPVNGVAVGGLATRRAVGDVRCGQALGRIKSEFRRLPLFHCPSSLSPCQVATTPKKGGRGKTWSHFISKLSTLMNTGP